MDDDVASHRAMMSDTIPDEMYEITWRDAKQMLDDAGPDAAFVLLVARDADTEYLTKFAFSTGRDAIPPEDLSRILKRWLREVEHKLEEE